MKRLHLFEITDFPKLESFRNYIVEGLEHVIATKQLYDPAIPEIVRVMKHMGTTSVVDQCSGTGGPWFHFLDKMIQLVPSFKLTLTDLYPDKMGRKRAAACADRVTYVADSVDILDIPPDLKGVRTIFTGYHHFRPQMAQRVLQAAVNDNAAICIFEFGERKISSLLYGLMVSPIQHITAAPSIKPFRISRLFWTYVIPLILFIAAWDGVVSGIRTYSPSDLKELVADVESTGYKWEIGQLDSPMVNRRITYLLGYPGKPADGSAGDTD